MGRPEVMRMSCSMRIGDESQEEGNRRLELRLGGICVRTTDKCFNVVDGLDSYLSIIEPGVERVGRAWSVGVEVLATRVYAIDVPLG